MYINHLNWLDFSQKFRLLKLIIIIEMMVYLLYLCGVNYLAWGIDVKTSKKDYLLWQ
jgi:hypothetical protein